VRPLRIISLVSLVYDVAIGITLLVAREWLARTFGVPSPQPPIFVEVTGVFMIAIGIGYLMPYRQPGACRGYLWVMGPLLKGGGAVTFVADYFAHASPAAFLLFAVTDGALALATLWALLKAEGNLPGAGLPP
jgi:hypothetical protein